MNDREEFLAYLKQVSEMVEKWPAWKKSGLNAPATVARPVQNLHKVGLRYPCYGYAAQPSGVK
ncbi:Uncharacterised protein [Leminorella richardii]|uniref:Uncharacterized protein n=1 Tax=Leminorella richardii TaxID=158841 RepID=A0A2X4VBB4_9GAMM|nr:hypothetical protein [Leminorella richardii]SQI44072.1 Uncharacterised protein [Leminorella richardii]